MTSAVTLGSKNHKLALFVVGLCSPHGNGRDNIAKGPLASEFSSCALQPSVDRN
jgi:hypothetical protein